MLHLGDKGTGVCRAGGRKATDSTANTGWNLREIPERTRNFRLGRKSHEPHFGKREKIREGDVTIPGRAAGGAGAST